MLIFLYGIELGAPPLRTTRETGCDHGVAFAQQQINHGN